MQNGNCYRKLNVAHKINAQSTIAKRYVNDIFKLKKFIFVKNPGAQFTLHQAISAENFNQSEYVAVGAMFRFAFLPFHRAFHYVNLSNMCSNKRSIHKSF